MSILRKAASGSEPLNILCVIDNLSTGGSQRQIINLATGLHRRGHYVSMFCYAPGSLLAQPLEEEGIHVHLQLKKSRFSFDVIQNLRHYIDQGKYEAVISFLSTPNFYAVLSSRLTRTHPAVIVSERFCDIPGYPNSIELAVRQLYRLSSKVVVNSHHQRLNFLRRYPWMGKRVVTIYNGYDLQKFIPPSYEPENAQLNILVVAGVSRYKNGLCLVRALDILGKDHGLRPRLSWAGNRIVSGDTWNYLSAMEDEIRHLGLSQQWQWLDQRIDIITLLHHHDVLVHPSYGEGLPNSVCEAMACGRPVIVSDTLDHPRLVRDGINGFLFDWRNPADLARKIKAFYDLSGDERHRMGENGRDFAEKNLSMERYVSDFEQILSEVVK
jgi:GalNAc-alpha-(1->4)-GalNAc-alpha-(1->3)-diNAcBac-PP-undecaprenol alpha-1,4-N-acetyl-D-galactosaminyltransferase